MIKTILKANLSVKPTSLGLSIDENFFYNQLREVLTHAKKLNNFVRVDMEDSPYTSSTIRIFKKLQSEFDNVGIVVQVYLKRTENDVKDLNSNQNKLQIMQRYLH